MLDMNHVSWRIYKAIVRREREVYVQWYWFYLCAIINFLPQWIRDRLIYLTSKLVSEK